VQRDIQMIQLEMKGMENRLVIKLGSIVAGLLGLTIAAVTLIMTMLH